ncbi:MAG: protein kinase [Polyangiaceae bacterium]
MNRSPRAFDVVADRFVIVSLAGQGGMGSVYRATDRITGDTVALKVVERAGTGVTEERFRREARALAAISHPAVARYVAEGSTPQLLWLAMEWLEGEDLQARIDREPIDVPSGIALAARVAEGIAEAHRVGVVHRDLKPSNLLLVGGDLRRVKIIDFGVARVSERARPLTRTGQMIGTVGFMAPEQIHGERDVDPRSDVFALGSVLFEVLTGRPAFPGASLIAIIAKVLREDPPRISAVGPAVPEALEALVASMMAKSREHRPSSMAAVAARLAEIERLVGEGVAPTRPPVLASVTGREQRLVSVLFVVPLAVEATSALSTIDDDGIADDATESLFGAEETSLDDAPAGAPGEPATRRVPPRPLGEAVLEAAEAAGADAIALGEGAYLLVVSAGGTAKDQAARAAVCALRLRDRGDCRAVVGTGLAEPTGGLPVGPAIDRAAQLIEAGELGGVALDDVTAALLDDGFQIDRAASPPLLLAHGEAVSPPRAGRTTPFVGRDKEIAMIDAMLAESFGEPVARVVVVTGPPGAGKSRLRIECLRRAEARPSLLAIVARAHQVGSGAALGFVRSIEQLLAARGSAPHDRGSRSALRSRRSTRATSSSTRGSSSGSSSAAPCTRARAPSSSPRAPSPGGSPSGSAARSWTCWSAPRSSARSS